MSDVPAWVVAKANTYAKLTGKTPFVIYQGLWNVMSRDIEREILPLVRDQGLSSIFVNTSWCDDDKSIGMALAPWDVLHGGRIRTDAEEQRRRESGEHGT